MAKYMTLQRKKLLMFLKENHDRQLSAAEIAEELKGEDISLSAVYRNLSELEADGLVSRFVKEGCREFFYQYIAVEQCKNCIHLTCTKCGAVSHMDNTAATEMISAIRKTAGFNINKSKTVVYGVCNKCEVN